MKQNWLITLLVQEGKVEWCMLISSSESIKIATICWTIIDRRMLKSTKKGYPTPKTKKSYQSGRGTIKTKSNPIPAWWVTHRLSSVQFISVTQSCLTLCNPMDCSMPGFSVHHQLPKPTQTHVHCIGDDIQPSHPLSFPSPPTFNLSQHQGLFQWISSSHQVAKVLEFQFQHQSFQWIFRTDFEIGRLDLLAVQGALKSLLQHHSSKTSILQRSALFIVQISHPSMTTGKP